MLWGTALAWAITARLPLHDILLATRFIMGKAPDSAGGLFCTYLLSSSGTMGSYVAPLEAAPAPKLAIASMREAIADHRPAIVNLSFL